MFEEGGSVLVVSPFDPVSVHAERAAVDQLAHQLHAVRVFHDGLERNRGRVLVEILETVKKPHTPNGRLDEERKKNLKKIVYIYIYRISNSLSFITKFIT